MAEKLESCAECTQNCVLIHANRNLPSPIVSSFFKVMFGDYCTHLLFVPPKFAPTVSSLVGQTTQLEDSCGQRWMVTLSKVNGSLAFQKGWHEFSSAHCLQVGEFLIFNYIKGSHFVVQIYDYTGCEKLVFSKENGARENCQTSGNSNPEDGGYSRKRSRTNEPHNGSSNKQASSTDIEMNKSQPILKDNNSNLNEEVNVTAPVCVEEQFYMIGRDAEYMQEDYKSALHDLSEFEMNKFSVETEKKPSPAANSTVRSLTEIETDNDNNRFDGDANKSTVEDRRIDGLANSVMRSSDDAREVATHPVAAERPNAGSSLRTEHSIRKDRYPSPRNKLVLSAEKDLKKMDAKLGKNLSVSKKVNFKNPEGKSNAYSSGIAKVVKTEIVDKFELQTFGFHGKLPSTIGDCDQSSKIPIKHNDDKIFKAELQKCLVFR